MPRSYKLIPHPSTNMNERIRFVVIHGTALNLTQSKSALDGSRANSPVSAHFLISDQVNEGGGADVFHLVEESKRAWHAGISDWQGRNNLNDTSIGIEVVNEAKDVRRALDGESLHCLYYPPFLDHQLAALAELVSDLSQKYDINPTCIVTHAMIAPNRKSDPGPGVMKALHERYNVGAWYDEAQVNSYCQQFEQIKSPQYPDITWVQQNLQAYGFKIQITGDLDLQTKQVLRAFMMNFRPDNYPGRVDETTCIGPGATSLASAWFKHSLEQSLDGEFYAILDSLTRRYMPEKLAQQGVLSLQEHLDAQHRQSSSMRP